jgi:hypothetical protein
MQDFYRLVGGFEGQANKVRETVCKKLVLDMHYEAQIQCIINYSASKLAKNMSKAEERTYKLTREQYEEVQLYFTLRTMLNMRFLHVVHFITCKCLCGGAATIWTAGNS